ncbi:MAG: TIGR00341 family protein [Candidatus Hinthialibacter antarcticus]|nr:TIGR00341 family protein [Candidatus Hinthialibacter antarcticus]
MSLRLIELYVSMNAAKWVQQSLDEHPAFVVETRNMEDERCCLHIISHSQKLEPLLDALEQKLSGTEFRIVLYPLVASLPRLEEPDNGDDEAEEQKSPERIHREELYNGLFESAQVNRAYIWMVILSAIVASGGLIRDNAAVIIGAMVIAPLLGPNMALALSFTLADFKLAKKALHTISVGFFISLGLALLLGLLYHPITPETHEFAARTDIALWDIMLALCSGAAAALSLTTGTASAMVGVMVAVALMPPLVAFGMLLGAGHFELALRAFILVFSNVICVNLAGVAMFRFQGIRPRTWWDEDRARRHSRQALMIWTLLLFCLIFIIVNYL